MPASSSTPGSIRLPSGEWRRRASAWLIVAAVVSHVVSITQQDTFIAIAGAFYWASLVLLWPDISGRNAKQVVIILAMATPGLALGIYGGNIGMGYTALTTNSGIITLLIAVGLYSLGTVKSVSDTQSTSSYGTKGFLSTYFNIHFVGSIINYAAVLIFGDRLHQRKSLTEQQAVMISRSFASAGFWSPLFVTMAVATSYSPGYSYGEIFIAGALMAITSFLYTFIGFISKPEQQQFQGLNISFETLRLPLLIAFIIGTAIYWMPDAKILNIVIVTAVLYGAVAMLVSHKNPIEHIHTNFPKHANEIALFLAAGLLNASFICIMEELDLTHVQQHITPLVCFIFIAISMALTCIGIHPLISITVFMSMANVTHDTANLMAFTLFSAWAIGSSLGPLSGQNIGINSRYGISSYKIMQRNLGHSLVLLLASGIIVLYIL